MSGASSVAGPSRPRKKPTGRRRKIDPEDYYVEPPGNTLTVLPEKAGGAPMTVFRMYDYRPTTREYTGVDIPWHVSEWGMGDIPPDMNEMKKERAELVKEWSANKDKLPGTRLLVDFEKLNTHSWMAGYMGMDVTSWQTYLDTEGKSRPRAPILCRPS